MRLHAACQRCFRHRLILLALCGIALSAGAFEFYRCVFHADNDFLWHRNLGQAFLNDQVYETFAYHYPPARAMIDATTAWLPYRVARALWLLGACVALAWCVRFWSTLGMTERRPWGWPAPAAVAVTGCYIQRDLPECGMQLLLLFLLSAGFAALVRGRAALSGWSIGLAAVYKVTPILFLPYLVWKRQWRAAAWMTVAMAAYCALPALYLGWQKDVALHRQWLSFVGHTLSLEDPSENGVEVPVLRNQSLPLMLARLVQKYPEDHPLYVESDAFVCLGSFESDEAKEFVQSVLLGLALVLALRFHRSADLSDGGDALAAEWSAICILVALLSPLCWLQHLVLVLPAALLFAQRAAAGHVARWQWRVAALSAALMLLVHRDLLGMKLCEMLSCYQPHTIAALLLMTLSLTIETAPAPSECQDEEEAQPTILKFPIPSAQLRQAA